MAFRKGNEQEEAEPLEQKLADFLERMNLHDWINQQMDTKLLIRQNLISGIARGLGIALGGGFVLGIVSAIAVAVKSLFF